MPAPSRQFLDYQSVPSGWIGKRRGSAVTSLVGLIWLGVSFGLSVGIAGAVATSLPFFGISDATCGPIAVCAMIVSFILLIAYGSLWLAGHGFRPGPPTTPGAERRARREESKFRTAEVRVGLVLAFLTGAAVGGLNGPRWAAVAACICGAMVGALIGHDLKRRWRRLRALESEVSP